MGSTWQPQLHPGAEGSFNYKVTFSIVLLARVDANYRFLVTKTGILAEPVVVVVRSETSLCRRLENNITHEPPPMPRRDA